MRLTEEKLERAFTNLVRQKGFRCHLTITHKPNEAVKSNLT